MTTSMWKCTHRDEKPSDPVVLVRASRAFDARQLAAMEFGSAPMNTFAKEVPETDDFNDHTIVYEIAWVGNAASNTLRKVVREKYRGDKVKDRLSHATATHPAHEVPGLALLGWSYDVRVGDVRRVLADLPDDMPVRLEALVRVNAAEVGEQTFDVMLCRMDVETLGDREEFVLFGAEEHAE